MKKMIFLVLLTLVFSILAAEFTIEQALIDSLTASAIKNIEPLPEKFQKTYNNYLEKYPDGIMAFMISAEDNSKLWDTDPTYFLDNYKIIKKLMKMEDYEKYSDKFVLSYIIKTTVSHEQFTNYRKVFAEYNLLNFVEESPDLADRIREINLWCRENMTFVSTSGRAQDPLSVLQKSNKGRCGEMQIFFISACRTIGIPARPAWTPWWAHTDNNHAWTEVFVDGKWHYVGAAEPGYYLDSTWFSRSVNKALLVLARSSFPDSLDDVIVKGRSNNYINSTRYYQKTRDVKFHVVDTENNPVDSVAINFFAFNFSMLRPLLGIRADSLGVATVNISYGSFLAIARKDSLYDFVLVPNSSDSAEFSFVLDDRKWEDQDFVFEYPLATGIKKDDPDFFAERKKNSVENYNELIRTIQAEKIPEFAPIEDTLFVEVFEKSRNNKQVLLKFIKENKNINTDFWASILEIDVKFFWQANLNQWQNIYEIYLELKSAEIDEDKLPNLLSPSVKYEMLPNTRVSEKYLTSTSKDNYERIPEIITKLHNNYLIDKDKATNGLLSLDRLLEAKYLQNFHFKTLCCYVLRANHIPAQYTRIPSTIMVMADSVWQNYDVVNNNFSKPQDNMDDVTSVLIPIEFELVDEAGLPVTINPDNISTTFFRNGRFYPNDRQLDYDKEESKLSGELEMGDYQLQIGIRESGEITKVKLISLQLENQEDIKQTLTFKDFKRNWKNADKKYLEFITSFADDLSKDCIVLLGDYDDEPVQRLATKTRINMDNKNFIWIGKNMTPKPIPNYLVSDEYEQFLEDNPELKHRLITFFYDSENEKWKIFEGNWDMLFK